MNTIRIHKHLESDTLHLPELRGLIGHDVEITVREQSAMSANLDAHSTEFWNSPSLDALAVRQRFLGPLETTQAFGSLAEADWEGFDEFLKLNRD